MKFHPKANKVLSVVLAVSMLMGSFTGVLGQGMTPIKDTLPQDSSISQDSNTPKDAGTTSEPVLTPTEKPEEPTPPENGSEGNQVPEEPPKEEGSQPEVTASPEATAPPEATASPEVTASPEATASPVVSPSPNPTPSVSPVPTATPSVEETFVPLEIKESSASNYTPEIGEKIDLFVKLNRDDVKVTYQWQKAFVEKKETTQPVHNYAEGDSTDYFFPLVDISEEEYLALNPTATWPGIEIYLDKAKNQKARGAVEPINIPEGTKNYVLNTEGVSFDAWGSTTVDETLWQNIDTKTNPTFSKTIEETDKSTFYRCVITVVDEAYIAAAKENEIKKPATYMEREVAKVLDVPVEEVNIPMAKPAAPPTTAPGPVPTATPADPVDGEMTISPTEENAPIILATEKLAMDVKEKEPFNLFSMFASNDASVNRVRLNGAWLENVASDMEYITADGYAMNGAAVENSPYWTKLYTSLKPNATGVDRFEKRADGTPYMTTTITSDGKIPILSAWYGKTIYIRKQGSNGTGKSIKIPAYSDEYNKTLYKDAISVLSVYIPETGMDFYDTYLTGVTDKANSFKLIKDYQRDGNGNLVRDANGRYIPSSWYDSSIIRTKVPLSPYDVRNKGISFNENPDAFLRDAEGNYRYDSVLYGVNVLSEPDISAAAAWALKGYISEGYGFMTGHDTMYGYGGVHPNSNYAPLTYEQAASGGILDQYYETPYYVANTREDGHWNINWLIGTNKLYTQAEPYEAPSMILCTGDYTDKSTLYGDTEINSQIRIVTEGGSDPTTNIFSRTPTNYPYSKILNMGTGQFDDIVQGYKLLSNATHTNQQIAYGTVWMDFATNSMADIGYGRLITDNRNGLYGTNNFYLTTNGNLALNQIGHLVTGKTYYPELQLLANTVMYISQRQQCQVCQSEQGGNEDIHFVHKIKTAEELGKLRDQTANWFTHPLDGCYMLSENIVLPEDWEPIPSFFGHFNADGHSVTSPNGKPVFKQAGTLGQYTSNTGSIGWNLGTDPKIGLNSIVNDKKGRTTGVARVSGYLSALFETGLTVDYSGYTVVIEGTDGNKYNCLVNFDSKYVISNLPTTGVMTARVYDRAGTEVTAYGPIRVNVSETYWNTNETTPLYLIGFTAQPVKNTKVYEGQTAYMLDGAVNWNKEVTDITWQYQEPKATVWRDVSTNKLFDYEYGKANFVDKGDDSYTETSLILKNCSEDFSGYKFRAVFKDGSMQTDTYKYNTNAKKGLLTVLPMPMYVTDPVPKTVWIDGTTELVSACEAVKGSDNGLRVQWQVRRWMTDSWMNVESYPDLTISPTSTSVVNVQTKDGKIDPLTPYKTTSTLSINVASVDLNGLYFRAVHSYENPFGKTRSKGSDGKAQITVIPPSATVEWAKDQDSRIGITFETPAIVPVGSEYSPDVVKYEADIYYEPGFAETTNGSPTPEVRWQYLNHGMLGSVGQTTWNAATAKALATKLGITAPSVTFSNSKPVKQPDGRYKITAKMEISNIHWKLYSDDCFLEFSVGPLLHYQTDPYKDFSTLSDPKGLFVDYKVGIKWNQGKNTENGDHTVWTYPNMTVNSVSGVKTMLLYFEGAVGTNFDARDKIVLKDNLLPPGMVLDVNSSKYLMFTVNGPNPVSDKDIQKYLRKNISLISYDTTKNPKIMAYINAEVDFAQNVKSRSGLVVNFLTDAKAPLEGQTSFPFLSPNTVIDVPTPVADEYYEFTGWEDEYGRGLSFWDTISISKSGSYTAKFKPINDANRNNIPDECEVVVTFKVENGMFKEDSLPHQEWQQYVTLIDEAGNPSPLGTATLSPSDYPSVFVNDGYVIGEWDNSTITTATTLTNKCTKITANAANKSTGNIIVLFSGGKGSLAGQTQFIVPIGSTWKDANISIPTAKTVETEKLDGIVEITSFAQWNKEIPTDDYVFTGKDGDVLSFVAEFSQESAVSEKAALANKRNFLQMANNFTDKAMEQEAAVSATPRYNGATLTINSNTGAGMAEGSSLSLAANGSAPYMQWEVNDKTGIWSECTAENYQTMIISRLLKNMEGWQYRLRYGNSKADSKVSNVVTVNYAFTNILVSGQSSLNLATSTSYGNILYYPERYSGRVSGVGYTFQIVNGIGTIVRSGFDNIGGTSYGRTDELQDLQSYVMSLHASVPGGRSVWTEQYYRQGHSSGQFIIRDVRISGVGGAGGSDSGLTIKRGIYEALDITSIWHEKTIASTPDVVATVSASNKVYNGEESVVSVSLFDRTGSLTPAQLETIKANGTIQYSNGKTTRGNATKGSECIDAGIYKGTFVPSGGDTKYFASNSIDEVRDRTETFNITKRPVNLFSTGNNKIYDGSANAIIRNIAIEELNTSTNIGVINRDTGMVDVSPKTLNGLYLDQNQTNNKQIGINPIGEVNLTGERANNYAIQSVNYTGAINPRGLTVHSKYLDTLDTKNNPRNIKVYDGTKSAVISKIIVDNVIMGDNVRLNADTYVGTYSTENSGEQLTADGKTKPNRLFSLTENVITRTTPISLVDNDNGNYFIETESYSGAIYRSTLEVRIQDIASPYGQKLPENATTAKTYSSTEVGKDATLSIVRLAEKDKLTINKKVSDFIYERKIDEKTPVGIYGLDFTGLTEENYPVLSNYIVYKQKGSITITPISLLIKVDGGYEKKYGEVNPAFGVKVEGFANNGDTVKNSLTGKLQFKTDCKWNSDVRYLTDNSTITGYEVKAYGLECALNENGLQNYDVSYQVGDIKVKPVDVVITAVSRQKTYGQNDPYLSYSLSMPRVKDSDLQVDLSRVEGNDVGQYKILFDKSSLNSTDESNYNIKFVSSIFTIIPRPLYIQAGRYAKYYGEENPKIDIYYANFAYGDSKESALEGKLVVENNAKKMSPVGDYKTNIRGESPKKNSNGLYNYDIVYFLGFISVRPRPLTIIADEQVKIFGEPDPELTWHLSRFGMPPVDPIEVTLAREKGEDVYGAYDIYSNEQEITDKHEPNCQHTLEVKYHNYDVTYVPAKLNIIKDINTDLVIKVADATMAYGEKEPTYKIEWYQDKNGKHILGGTDDVMNITDIALRGKLDFKADGTTHRDVGNYAINTSGVTSDKYANVVFLPGQLEVTPRPIVIKAKDTAKVYGDADPALKYSLTDTLSGKVYEDGLSPDGRINPTDLQGELSRYAGENVGKYDITIGKIADKNYSITFEKAIFSITKAELKITVWNNETQDGSFSKTYGDTNPNFAVKYDGFKQGDTEKSLHGDLTYATPANKQSPVSEYPIIAIGLENDNYDIIYVDGTLKVTPLSATVVIDSKTKVYGTKDPVLTWHLSDGMTEVDATNSPINGTLSRAEGEDVNAYKITGEFTNVDNPNYAITVIDNVCTITPAKLTVKAVDKAKHYATENPEWTSEYVGFAFNDTEASLNGSIIYSVKETDGVTDVSKSTDVGKYGINISNNSTLASKNYDISYTDAILTIVPSPIYVNAINLKFKKTWNDSDTVDHSNDSATVVLYANGTGINTVDLNSKNNWSYSFDGLPFADANGTLIEYTAKETLYRINGELYVFGTGPYSSQVTDNGTVETSPSIWECVLTIENIAGGITPPDKNVSIVKSANKTDILVGETVDYTVSVTNTGNTELTNFTVSDNLTATGKITAQNGTGYTYNGNGEFTIIRLPVGKTIVIHYSYTALPPDKGATISNIAVASIPGEDGQPNITVPSDEIKVNVKDVDPTEPPKEKNKDFDVVKSADKAFAKVGETITYTLKVTNTGNVDLKNVSITDNSNAAGSISATSGNGYVYNGNGKFVIGEILVGESKDIVYSYIVKDADAGRIIENTAIAVAPKDPANPDDKGDVTKPSNKVETTIDEKPVPQGAAIAKPSQKVYGDKDPQLSYTLNFTPEKTTDIWGNVARVEGEDVGVYTIGQGTLESKNYDLIFQPSVFTIYPAEIVVTAENQSKMYGDPIPTLTANTKGFKFSDTIAAATENNLQIDTTANANSNVGKYPILPNGLTVKENSQGNHNYVVKYVNAELTISKKSIGITITADDNSKIYGSSEPKLTYTVSEPPLKVTDIWGSPERELGENVGDYQINQGSIASDNYSFTFTPGKFTVTPATLTVTAQNKNKIYGEENPIWTSTYNGFVLDETETVLTGTLHYLVQEADGKTDVSKLTDIGEYPINIKDKSTLANKNYIINYVNGILDINKGKITVKADDKTKIYGKEDPEFTYVVEGTTENPSDITGTPIRKPGENVGEYEIDQGTVTSPNFEIVFVPGKLDITPAPLTVTAENKSKVYGDENPKWTVDYNGFALNETQKVLDGSLIYSVKEKDNKLDVSKTTNVGKYPIDIASQSTLSSQNYTVSYVNGELDITKRKITITADDQVKNKGEKDPELTYSKSEDLVKESDLSGTLDRIPGEDDGKYPIKEGTLTSDNYDITFVEGELTIKTKQIRDLWITKTSNVTTAKQGDKVVYEIIVKNIGNTTLNNVIIKDNFNGKGSISAVNGDKYQYNGNGEFLIPVIEPDEKIIIQYEYIVTEQDAGLAIKNIAVATIPTDPTDPDSKPIDVPSKEVIIDVEKPIIPPVEKPEATPTPEESPIISIFNPKTGLSFIDGNLWLFAIITITAIVAAVAFFLAKRKK